MLSPVTQPSSPLVVRPDPNSTAADANVDNPTTGPAAASGTTITMSNPATTTSAHQGDEQAPRARRQSTAEALAASADLEEALVSPTSAEHHHDPSSSAAVADEEGAERARTATEAWKPAINRRQSWNREEQKRSLQMSSIADVKTGPGFSERAAAQ